MARAVCFHRHSPARFSAQRRRSAKKNLKKSAKETAKETTKTWP
jgi:hypothetical protein